MSKNSYCTLHRRKSYNSTGALERAIQPLTNLVRAILKTEHWTQSDFEGIKINAIWLASRKNT